ncbi:MAG: hypothetical protein SFU56_17715 [Capsulimonadales bacterium]|nr:hypothetical protein [Capsulimonadales bacterium]
MRLEMRLEEEELRQVTLYAVICARPVLPIFEAIRPQDVRPRDALAGAEAFAGGQRRTAALRASAWAARAAAREVDRESAAHAAYAAGHAAAAAFLHPIASPHQVKHILGAAIHQALAFERGTPEDEESVHERLRWAASLANATVRDVLQRFPPPDPGRGRFGRLLSDLDAQLRDERPKG